ncbi:hypothetical protein [Roseomonas elaeocarpi]|uniref:ApeA N-terminal domain-containing protein n=1 Tax=Roseomonas elaeocarpi TaxID=907779 RepID=A0ABV6JVH5_9PROT
MRQVFHLNFNEDGGSDRYRREGWSGQERDMVWSVGHDSVLELPPMPADLVGTLRIQGRVNPHRNLAYDLAGQRLALRVNEANCGEILVDALGDISFDVPAAALRGDAPNTLRFHHPDGVAPAVAARRPDFDHRELALAWFSMRLLVPESEVAGGQAATVLISGDHQAAQLASLLGRLTTLAGRLTPRHVEPGETLDAALREAREAGPVGVWRQVPLASAPTSTAAEVLAFPQLRCDLLWPLLDQDPPALPETAQGDSPRYGMTDAVMEALAPRAADLSDSALFRQYLLDTRAMLDNAPPSLAAELTAWRRRDEGCDVRLAERFAALFTEVPLFNAPQDPKAPLMRFLAAELLRRTTLIDPATRDAALIELVEITRNWLGIRPLEQVPVHPEVARHLGLAWYNSETRYLWHNNEWTFREAVLRGIRRAPWAT